MFQIHIKCNQLHQVLCSRPCRYLEKVVMMSIPGNNGQENAAEGECCGSMCGNRCTIEGRPVHSDADVPPVEAVDVPVNCDEQSTHAEVPSGTWNMVHIAS